MLFGYETGVPKFACHDRIVGLKETAVRETDNELIGGFAVAVARGSVFNADEVSEADKEFLFVELSILVIFNACFCCF